VAGLTEKEKSMTTRLEQLKAKAERVRDEFESGQKELFRSDGTQVYGEVEHLERLGKLRAERNTELAQIEAETTALVEEANKEIAALEHGDVTAWLSEPELQRASTRQTLIAADVSMLSRDELQERLSAVSHQSDWASKFCYWMMMCARVSSTEDVEMLDTLANLKESIIPNSHRSKMEAARRELETAHEVKSITYYARREMSGALGGYAPNYVRPAGR
jgi:hypothetical protein